ncbi:MAG: MarR family winged helix-turn-helix transcriptional regulator [Acetobacteraceae bacterium]
MPIPVAPMLAPLASPDMETGHTATGHTQTGHTAIGHTDTGPALRAYVKLLRAVRAIEARLEPRVLAAGLTPTQLGVMEALLHKGPLTQVVLGRKLLTSAANMTDVIDKLARRGLVHRGRKPGDRRAVWVGLTAPGRAAITELFPRHAAAIAAAMAGLNAAELDTLGELLRTLGRTASGAWEASADAEADPDPLAEERGLPHLPGNSFGIER